MLPTPKDWLHRLVTAVRSAQLDHLDILINCAALPASSFPTLLELTPALSCAWLFEQTLEQDLAHQGPALLRIELANQEQCAGLTDLLNATHYNFCVLAVISRWPFADLAAHLRYATQTTWSKGARCGVLRYYDTRLFRLFCDQLDPHQQGFFHAPVIQWHWIDHDRKAATLSGFDSRPGDQNALDRMSMSDEQILHLQAVSAAIRWLRDHDNSPNAHGFTSREAMLRGLITVHLDISRQKLEKRHHEDFIANALSEHPPLSLTRHKAVL